MAYVRKLTISRWDYTTVGAVIRVLEKVIQRFSKPVAGLVLQHFCLRVNVRKVVMQLIHQEGFPEAVLTNQLGRVLLPFSGEGNPRVGSCTTSPSSASLEIISVTEPAAIPSPNEISLLETFL